MENSLGVFKWDFWIIVYIYTDYSINYLSKQLGQLIPSS